MTMIRQRLTRRLGPGLAGALLIAGIGAPAGAAPPDPVPDPAGDNGVTVTLITGDTVSITQLGGGRQAVHVTPGKGRSGVVFHQQEEAGELSVIPSDALGLLHTGTLDDRLFNVTALIRDRFDDAHLDALPLIVGHTGDRAPVALARADGATNERTLESIDATAVEQRRDEAAEFWADIVREPAARAVREPAALAPGLRKVWLDARYETRDDVGNAQIGVPAAREAGYTGKGAKVAVLDTGWDHDHPDLQGRVVAEHNFANGSDNADDDNGHGTHVAGIVAGSGGASGGRYEGVAPDADLLVGQVLGASGSGFGSDIIEGMEWAVAQGADVVNLSLGSRTPSAGDDVLSQAVNTLSAQSDTLFVVAAGNSGPGATTVGAPAAADAALTVGAVDSADAIASFSSRGPRLGDGAIKPDITAPGVNVIAARAKGTPAGDRDPVDDNYARLSGTSMAAPATAGAAALLAQAHPKWDGERLKAALTATASPQPGQSVYDQGSGLTDVARAVRQPVTATPTSLRMGSFQWPHADNAAVTRTVTYRNDGDAPVTLRLSPSLSAPDGGSPPTGLLSLSETEITVPARGTADVDVTVDPANATPTGGEYGWWLEATGPDGATRVQTTVAAQFEPESYEFAFTAVDRDGNRPLGIHPTVVMVDPLDRIGPSTSVWVSAATAPTVRMRLPKGEYGITATTHTADPETRQSIDVTLESRPRVTLDRTTSIAFDARKGKPVSVGVEGDDTVAPWFEDLGGLHTAVDGSGARETSRWGLWRPDFSPTTFRAVPTPAREQDSSYRYYYRTTLAEPADPGALNPGPLYSLLEHEKGGIPARLSYDVPTRELAKVDAWYGKRDRQFDGAARVIAGFIPGLGGTNFTEVRNVPIPGRRVEYYSADPEVSWTGAMGHYKTSDGRGYYALGHQYSDLRTYRPGERVKEMWNYPVAGPSLPANGEFLTRTGDRIKPQFSPWGDSDPHHHYYNDRAMSTGKALLYRDGTLVGELNSPWPDEENFDNFDEHWTVPAETANYRLDATFSREQLWHGQRSHRVEASWTFRSGHTDATTSLPLTVVRFQPPTDPHGVAPADTRFEVPFVVQQQGSPSHRRLRTVTVEASYDNGATWTRVPATAWGSKGTALLTHPASSTGSGWVSLRTSGEDAAGNTFSQTVFRAYRYLG
ncbi:S8 family peptidase [Streptomyces sp. NPDC002845]